MSHCEISKLFRNRMLEFRNFEIFESAFEIVSLVTTQCPQLFLQKYYITKLKIRCKLCAICAIKLQKQLFLPFKNEKIVCNPCSQSAKIAIFAPQNAKIVGNIFLFHAIFALYFEKIAIFAFYFRKNQNEKRNSKLLSSNK